MRAKELLETLTDDELKERANGCLTEAEMIDVNQRPAERQRLLTEADFYLKALIWRHDTRNSERDFRLEKVVITLISVEIVLSLIFGFLALWEGWKEGRVLSHMDTSTAATSDSLQKLVAAQDASLRILQQEQAEASKKPRFALYVGNIPLDKATAHLNPRTGSAQDMASLDLLLKNEGDVPASPSQIHVLVPEGIYLELSPIPPVPEYEEPSNPATRTMSYAVPLMPVGKTLRIHANIGAPKGHASLSAAFTITTPQLQAVTPLGSLTILPPKP
jgi:hypothetical protein